ncbi:MAG: hypothetical protein AAGJ69_07935, partial [Cyanobacteria bacterium J06559_1]
RRSPLPFTENYSVLSPEVLTNESGRALARQGDVEGAVRKFERAKGLDPELVIDAVGRARELAGFDSAQPTEARE